MRELIQRINPIEKSNIAKVIVVALDTIGVSDQDAANLLGMVESIAKQTAIQSAILVARMK